MDLDLSSFIESGSRPSGEVFKYREKSIEFLG